MTHDHNTTKGERLLVQESTIQTLRADYARFEGMAATGATASEIELASQTLGIPFPSDYIEFLSIFGGGYARSYAIAGLREWQMAANDWHVVTKTQQFSTPPFPGTEGWIIFSDDGCGNPIGFDREGRVWISDHDSRECICLEQSFDAWLRRWALDLEPRGQYIFKHPWSQI
jgi:hypothetical protein